MNKRTPEKAVLQWHPAFFADLQIELQDYANLLTFENEHQLGTKPKEIDVLIIKKEETAPISKNIGQIFRKYNIVEYKSPEDYLSVEDYYKVFAYAYLYQSDTIPGHRIDIRDITITVVSHSYPRKLIQHLRKDRGLNVLYMESGIYRVIGESFPVQIIVTRKLSKEKNFWLRNLTNRLESDQDVWDIVNAYRKKQDNELYRSVMNIVVRANSERFEGENMCKAMEDIIEPRIQEREQIVLEDTVFLSICNIMDSLSISAEDAMNLLKIPEIERKKYLQRFSQENLT